MVDEYQPRRRSGIGIRRDDELFLIAKGDWMVLEELQKMPELLENEFAGVQAKVGRPSAPWPGRGEVRNKYL